MAEYEMEQVGLLKTIWIEMQYVRARVSEDESYEERLTPLRKAYRSNLDELAAWKVMISREKFSNPQDLVSKVELYKLFYNDIVIEDLVDYKAEEEA